MKRRPLVQLVTAAFPGLTAERAYALILSGEILVNGERVRDSRRTFDESAEIARKPQGFVSRGGTKLAAAIEEWHIDVRGKVFLDAGASTGGFTDCLLRRGARHVHAVEAGTNQLAYALRTDSRVSVHERTNVLDVSFLDPPADAAVADLSLRSLRGVCAHLLDLSRERWAIVLVKPQYERGAAGEAGRQGSLDRSDLRARIESLLVALEQERAYVVKLMESPIRGRRGNLEFLGLVKDVPEVSPDDLISRLALGS